MSSNGPKARQAAIIIIIFFFFNEIYYNDFTLISITPNFCNNLTLCYFKNKNVLVKKTIIMLNKLDPVIFRPLQLVFLYFHQYFQ